jgi:sugar lactone lactonase YvrE
VTVGNTWFAENGARLAELDRRVVLSRDLAPGESVELPLTLTTPAQPGNYTLRIDAVQEGVAWFGDMGSEVLNLKLRVE